MREHAFAKARMKYFAIKLFELFRLMLFRPHQVQIAALCYRKTKQGEVEFLLVTSRETKRWILPKGWVMKNKSGVQAAIREAWEEAGVADVIETKEPIGFYLYQKILKSGITYKIRTSVYPLLVKKIEGKYPEAHQRERKWCSLGEAVELIGEPDLARLISNISKEELFFEQIS
jgi:8-oxo-dGTP pyrophosphatase MutT (NUDIX family)